MYQWCTNTGLTKLQCFYSNALGRVKSAHVYSGLALRLSTCLGLHRKLADGSVLSPAEQEHRVRLWWTVYCFDRSTSLRIGQPLSIDDADIDVRGPSSDTLPDRAKEKFNHPDHLCANVELSQIEGSIMRRIYSISNSSSLENFVDSVRTILTRLRTWDSKLSDRLRLGSGALDRPAASLQLHFNQCIILTTRPILLHALKASNPFSGTGEDLTSSSISETSMKLAEACIAAARTSSRILSQLFVENSLATYGYFDAHNLFSSTLIIMISAIISPTSKDSDAVQMSFHILKSMRDNGNTAATQCFDRLTHVQSTIARLRSHITIGSAAAMMPTEDTQPPIADLGELDDMNFQEFDWAGSLDAEEGFRDLNWNFEGISPVDPLGDPLLQSFLGQMDGSLDCESAPQIGNLEHVGTAHV